MPRVGTGAGAGGDDADGDRIRALPDGDLLHALGFLPARDAVRTCVLGRLWGNQWRALPRLRITGAEKLHMFVNQLVLLRYPGLVLDECEIDLRGLGYANRMHVNLWIRHALLLRARVLCLRWIPGLQSQPLASMFLKVLHLVGVSFEGNIIDFSSCPALEDLEITSSEIDAHVISSPSAKRLRLVKCSFILCPCPDYRTRISTPSIICLEVEDCSGFPHLLQSMPSLHTASVCVGCFDEDEWEESCSVGERVDGSVLLGGLPNATNLMFRASFGIMV
ncbi:hypothetical protein SETIT_8G066100v2 [Setaria italica]|uniref:FBD domain-containing protein n=1 Tax=Setaria italica TaxID=4555 RepID=A0A368S4Y4_SETIT|nr:hypothetical protein SETIT_8G066100v2 [Setaria italica]